jgi:hypothetical protein
MTYYLRENNGFLNSKTEYKIGDVIETDGKKFEVTARGLFFDKNYLRYWGYNIKVIP